MCAAAPDQNGCEHTCISVGCANTPGKVKDSCRNACNNCNGKSIISYTKVQHTFMVREICNHLF